MSKNAVLAVLNKENLSNEDKASQLMALFIREPNNWIRFRTAWKLEQQMNVIGLTGAEMKAALTKAYEPYKPASSKKADKTDATTKIAAYCTRIEAEYKEYTAAVAQVREDRSNKSADNSDAEAEE